MSARTENGWKEQAKSDVYSTVDTCFHGVVGSNFLFYCFLLYVLQHGHGREKKKTAIGYGVLDRGSDGSGFLRMGVPWRKRQSGIRLCPGQQFYRVPVKRCDPVAGTCLCVCRYLMIKS